MTSQWRHRNETHSCYSELNYVQNLYFRFFIFWKLTELCRFVTYLWDDPRTSPQPSLSRILELPRTCTSLGDRPFTVAGPRLLNNPTPHLRPSELALMEYCWLLKTPSFCWRPRGLVTVAFLNYILAGWRAPHCNIDQLISGTAVTAADRWWNRSCSMNNWEWCYLLFHQCGVDFVLRAANIVLQSRSCCGLRRTSPVARRIGCVRVW